MLHQEMESYEITTRKQIKRKIKTLKWVKSGLEISCFLCLVSLAGFCNGYVLLAVIAVLATQKATNLKCLIETLEIWLNRPEF